LDLNLAAFDKGYEFGLNLAPPEPSSEDVDAALLAIEAME
jgi:hypothetical protein